MADASFVQLEGLPGFWFGVITTLVVVVSILLCLCQRNVSRGSIVTPVTLANVSRLEVKLPELLKMLHYNVILAPRESCLALTVAVAHYIATCRASDPFRTMVLERLTAVLDTLGKKQGPISLTNLSLKSVNLGNQYPRLNGLRVCSVPVPREKSTRLVLECELNWNDSIAIELTTSVQFSFLMTLPVAVTIVIPAIRGKVHAQFFRQLNGAEAIHLGMAPDVSLDIQVKSSLGGVVKVENNQTLAWLIVEPLRRAITERLVAPLGGVTVSLPFLSPTTSDPDSPSKDFASAVAALPIFSSSSGPTIDSKLAPAASTFARPVPTPTPPSPSTNPDMPRLSATITPVKASATKNSSTSSPLSKQPTSTSSVKLASVTTAATTITTPTTATTPMTPSKPPPAPFVPLTATANQGSDSSQSLSQPTSSATPMRPSILSSSLLRSSSMSPSISTYTKLRDSEANLLKTSSVSLSRRDSVSSTSSSTSIASRSAGPLSFVKSPHGLRATDSLNNSDGENDIDDNGDDDEDDVVERSSSHIDDSFDDMSSNEGEPESAHHENTENFANGFDHEDEPRHFIRPGSGLKILAEDGRIKTKKN